jgi:hypothetical protein
MDSACTGLTIEKIATKAANHHNDLRIFALLELVEDICLPFQDSARL